MDLFKLKFEEESVRIYARVPQHIIQVVELYRERARKEGILNDPRLAKWVSRVPTLEEIIKIEKGHILYHAGMWMMKTGDAEADADLFCERMQVTDDFEVAATPESVLYFDTHRQVLPSSKRGELYKFQVDNAVFGGLYFVPEDVMAGIIDYDLTPHMERAKAFRERIERVKAGCPNLA